jgi:hypothetical protein
LTLQQSTGHFSAQVASHRRSQLALRPAPQQRVTTVSGATGIAAAVMSLGLPCRVVPLAVVMVVVLTALAHTRVRTQYLGTATEPDRTLKPVWGGQDGVLGAAG